MSDQLSQVEAVFSDQLRQVEAVYEKEVQSAYKSGRAIIASETADRMNQYHNRLKTCSSQIRERTGHLAKKIQKLELLLENQSNLPAKATGIKDFLETLRVDVIKGISEEVKDMGDCLHNLITYGSSMERIAKVKDADWKLRVDVVRTLDVVLEDMKPHLDREQIQFEVNKKASNLLTMVNPFWLGRVIKGIIKEAVLNLEKQTEQKKISLVLSEGSGWCVIALENNGKTLSDQERDSFFHMDQANTDAIHGMYFFASLMQRMGGDIKIEEGQREEGYELSLCVPLKE